MTNLLDLTWPELEAFMAELGEPRFRALQIWQWIWQKNIVDFDAMTNLSKAARAKLREAAECCLPEVADVQEQILGTYVDDFAKYANGRDLALMQAIFRRIPTCVGQKVKYVNFAREAKSREVKSILDLFAKALGTV